MGPFRAPACAPFGFSLRSKVPSDSLRSSSAHLRPRSEVRLANPGRVRRVRWHFGLAPERIVKCSRISCARVIAQYFVVGIPTSLSCARLAARNPNRIFLSLLARHSTPPPAPHLYSILFLFTSLHYNRVNPHLKWRGSPRHHLHLYTAKNTTRNENHHILSMFSMFYTAKSVCDSAVTKSFHCDKFRVFCHYTPFE